jgi:hypothetical protein
MGHLPTGLVHSQGEKSPPRSKPAPLPTEASGVADMFRLDILEPGKIADDEPLIVIRRI